MEILMGVLENVCRAWYLAERRRDFSCVCVLPVFPAIPFGLLNHQKFLPLVSQ